MFIYHIYLIIVGCSSDQVNQEISETSDVLDIYNFDLANVYEILGDTETFLNFQNVDFNHTEAGNNVENINGCASNSNNNIQEKFDYVSSPFNNSNVNNSQNANSTSKIVDENMIFNTYTQTNEDSLAFITSQLQNNAGLQLPICDIELENTTDSSSEDDNGTSDILNEAFKAVFSDMENDTVKRMLLDDENTNKGENKRRKRNNTDSEYSDNHDFLLDSNIIANSEIQNLNGEVKLNETNNLTADQRTTSIEKLPEKIQIAMKNLKMLKPYPEGFLKSLTHDQSCYSSLSSVFNKLNKIDNYIEKLFNVLVPKRKFIIEDSVDNGKIFGAILKLLSNTREAKYFFETSICQKLTKLSPEGLSDNIKILKNKIEKIENLIEKLKNLGIERISETEISKQKLIENCEPRVIKFSYQDDKSSKIQTFKISVKNFTYPISLSLFEESIFLCICNTYQYLNILKINLKERTCEEIYEYQIIGEDGNMSSISFGYGTKDTVIRSGSDGKLVLLKSLLKEQSESATIARNSFELLSIDKNRNKFACIRIDAIKSEDTFNQPAIADFVIHNDLIYALDMKCGCIKIFNESLELLKIIPFPESFTEIKDVHLAVSSKYILLGARKYIYYIKNNEQITEFKRLELPTLLHNFAFYNDEEIIVRFINSCFSFKIEENMSDIRYTHLPSLDFLKGFSLTNFVVKDRYVYVMCKKPDQICRINLTLNSTEVEIK